MKIAIVGYGFVGKAIFNALKTKHNVVIVDPQYTSNEIQHHQDLDGIIICVPTPNLDDVGCNASNVLSVLDKCPKEVPVLIKSTITPAVANLIDTEYSELTITYSPEFLRAKTSEQDFLNQTHMVFGGEDPEGFWQDTFTPVLKNCKIYFHCSPTEAATIKYATNAFLATKVAFFNQLHDLCQQNNADFDVVRQIVAQDPRIGASHTLVPGQDGVKGFGGACLPKDTSALAIYADSIAVNLSILKEVIQYNTKVRLK